MNAKIFLLRHADYGHGSDPHLSDYGKEQALKLAQKIKANLNKGTVTIWTSSANRATGTAKIIQQEMQLAEMSITEKLWSDNGHSEDFKWLKGELDQFTGDNLIIVSHLEYVREFPVMLGFSENRANYAQGVMITGSSCVDFR